MILMVGLLVMSLCFGSIILLLSPKNQLMYEFSFSFLISWCLLIFILQVENYLIFPTSFWTSDFGLKNDFLGNHKAFLKDLWIIPYNSKKVHWVLLLVLLPKDKENVNYSHFPSFCQIPFYFPFLAFDRFQCLF